jgi:hypothetical protein
MSDRRTLVLDERDLVITCAGTREALHAAVSRLYEHAKERVAGAPDKVDRETGEVEPRVWRLIFGEDTDDITTRQRGFLHAAVFPQISEQARLNGVGATAAGWKEWYRAEFLGWKWAVVDVPGKLTSGGKPVKKRMKVRVSTEDLGPRLYSDYIDRVIAHATTEFGVVFVFRDEEREAVRYTRPARKQPRQPAEAAAAL